VDVGDGIIVRYKDDTKEVIGLTIIGFKERFLRVIKE